MNVLVVCIISFLINVFLGKWRARYKKMTIRWWLLIHASIPFIIPLRIWLDTPKIYIPVFIVFAVAGQFVGSKLLVKIGLKGDVAETE